MLSYSRGPEGPLIDRTIPQVLEATAAAYPDRDALVVRHQNIRLTWREFSDAVDQTARGLAGLGLQAGDRVGVWSANCLEWLLLQFGTARAGLVLVNVNPAYRSHELRYVLKQSGMRALFLWESDDCSNYRQIFEEASANEQLALAHTVYFGDDTWRGVGESRAALPQMPADPHAVVNMQYTSGTTGAPKGVLLTHYNLVNNAVSMAAGLQGSANDRVCIPVPLYHCFGCVIGSMASVAIGAAMILPGPRFDARATLAAIADERATIIYGVPAMFIAELERAEFASFNLSSLRTGVMAGAPCPIEVMKRVLSEMHCSGMTIAYGQTEASPLITMSKSDDPVEARVSTVGAAIANAEVKIVSPSGEIVPRGERGELCGRGYMVMKGYDGDPEATARAIDPEGWLHTGDLAMMLPDGYVKITGRAKDMIIRGGENISPREIEEFLHTHPSICEVQVVGVPDARLGEAVAVWVRLRAGALATEDEVREYCRGRIAHFKVPQYIRFVDAFPMTVTGKIQKFRMREVEIRERSLGNAANVETA